MFRFPKNQKLCNNTDIDILFDEGTSISLNSFRIVWSYNEKKDDYLTKKGFMDNRNNRSNYTLKIFDRAYEKIGENEKFDSTKKVMVDYGTSMFPSYDKSDLKDIKTPILVIVAEKDDRIKPDHTIQISKLIKNSKLEVVKGAPHFGIVKRKKYQPFNWRSFKK